MLTAKLVRLQVRLSAFMYLIITQIILFERMMSKNDLEQHFRKSNCYFYIKVSFLCLPINVTVLTKLHFFNHGSKLINWYKVQAIFYFLFPFCLFRDVIVLFCCTSITALCIFSFFASPLHMQYYTFLRHIYANLLSDINSILLFAMLLTRYRYGYPPTFVPTGNH